MKLDNNDNKINNDNKHNQYYYMFDNNRNIMKINFESFKTMKYAEIISLIFSLCFNELISFYKEQNVLTYEKIESSLKVYFENDADLQYHINQSIMTYLNDVENFIEDSDNGNGFVLFMDSIISKIELIIRKICKKNNILTIKQYSDKNQEVKSLNSIFKDGEFKELISNKDYEFLETVLLKDGFNLRNKLAHGLDLEIYNFTNANLLFFCFLRLMKYL